MFITEDDDSASMRCAQGCRINAAARYNAG